MNRVLFVIDSLAPGGAERSLIELIPAIAEAGVIPAVVCLKSAQPSLESEAIERGVNVTVLASRQRLAQVLELRKLIRELEPALIHTTLFESDVLGRLAALGLGVRVTTSLVNTSYDHRRLQDPDLKRWRLGVAKRIDGFTARRLGGSFHAISETVKAAALRDLGIESEQVEVIPRTRDLSRLGEPSLTRRAAARRGLELEAGDEVVINLGRQEYQKGQLVLLEAVKRLENNHPRLVALIAGREGNASTGLRAECARLGVENRVRMLGHRSDVGELLAAADVFAFPSLFEGLGGSLLEALAMGLPVVASDLPAIREAVSGHRAVALCQPGDSAELAAAISRFLRKPQIQSDILARSARASTAIGESGANERFADWIRQQANRSD